MAPSSTDPLEVITEALQDKRPLVLFAGQSLDSANDAILGALLDRFGCTDCRSGWYATLKRGISAADMEWLSERFDRSVPSDAVAPIFDVAWSAVFTSSIDPRFARRFETRGRQPESVISRDTYARVPRSRSRPPIYYLLGKSDETVDYARAPGTRSDLQRRLGLHATELLNRIAETATVHGLVVIAGYAPGNDWMPPDSLLAPLSSHAGPTVLWFDYPGASDSIFADEMIRKGSLIATTETLTSAIGQLELRGVLDVAGSAAPDEPGMVSIAGGTVLDITPALRLRVEASAAIVDDGWTEEPEPLGERESDDAFRRFHSTPGNFRLLMDGVSQGFAIERAFEQSLWKTVTNKSKRLGQPDSDDVVILHGQSGTGKSIALARLARKIRLELRLPVVVATHRIPADSDIEAFCLESERLEAAATVLICDSNQAPQRYDDLASALRSRGRRLLIVGTCYRMQTHIGGHSDRFIEAPTRVSPHELSAFEKLRTEFWHDLLLPRNSTDNSTDSIFAMLYRRLAASRGRLAAGVSSEARVVESLLRERARHAPRPVTELSPLAQQLIDLGLVRDSQWFEDDDKLAALGLDAAGRLIDYVMVAGRLNCPVPVSLVFRLLSQTDELDLNQINYFFTDLDLIRRHEDDQGTDYLLKPRLQLEADLICRRRLTSDLEIERLIDLISSARPGIDRGTERSFLLNLLYMIDRNGPRKAAYRSGYLRFADALKQLREHHRISHPDLVLRECVFRRRTVQYTAESDSDMTEDERLAILDEARRAVEKTLLEIDSGDVKVSKRTNQSLVTERSTIYGHLAVERAQSSVGEGFWSDYMAARSASEEAIGLGRSSHPIDVALWTASDVLKLRRGELSRAQRAEVLADLYTTIDVADDMFRVKDRKIEMSVGLQRDDVQKNSDLDDGLFAENEKARYLERRSRVAYAIGDARLNDETLRELEGLVPAAATFLVARRLAEQVDASLPPLDNRTRGIAAEAADYISNRVDAGIMLDDRCQRLLLRLRWAQATGDRLMFNQRGRTPVDHELLFDLQGIVSTLNEHGGTGARNRERFLEAVLNWLLKDTSRAIEIWQSLSHDTEYEDPSRVVRWLVVTDEHGSPRRFRGRVEKKSENDWVRVEGFDRPIRLLSHEFPNDELDHGRELRGFGIAFNYIGPIADSLSRPIRRR